MDDLLGAWEAREMGCSNGTRRLSPSLAALCCSVSVYRATIHAVAPARNRALFATSPLVRHV